MEWKGGRTMKRCVSPARPEEPTSTSAGAFLISLLRRSRSEHYSRPVEFPGLTGRGKAGSSPHTQKKGPDNGKFPPPKKP